MAIAIPCRAAPIDHVPPLRRCRSQGNGWAPQKKQKQSAIRLRHRSPFYSILVAHDAQSELTRRLLFTAPRYSELELKRSLPVPASRCLLEMPCDLHGPASVVATANIAGEILIDGVLFAYRAGSRISDVLAWTAQEQSRVT